MVERDAHSGGLSSRQHPLTVRNPLVVTVLAHRSTSGTYGLRREFELVVAIGCGGQPLEVGGRESAGIDLTHTVGLPWHQEGETPREPCGFCDSQAFLS